MSTVIKIENLWKEYRLGVIGHGTLRADLQSWWAHIRGKEDPNSRVPMLAGQEKQIEGKRFWALRGIDLEIKQGEILGIIGKNGAGKSTLLKILSRVTAPSEGRIKVKGKIASLLEVGTGFHPELTGRENIYMNGAVLGMTKQEITRKLDEIIDFSGIEDFIETPVKRYSSGMYVRLAFAVAAHLDPEILIVDEVLAVGDAEFQKKCLGKMKEVSGQGRTVLFVSHNMTAIQKLCSTAIILEKGKNVFEGDVGLAVPKYLNRNADDLRAVFKWNETHIAKLSSSKLVEANIRNTGKKNSTEISTESPIEIQVYFDVFKPAKVGTSVLFYNDKREQVFSSISNHESQWHGKIRELGRYQSVCIIPANLLAEGKYSVDIILWEGHYEHGVHEEYVLEINAYESGFLYGELPYKISEGMIHPLFEWRSRLVT